MAEAAQRDDRGYVWAFHLFVGVVAVSMLWAASIPGGSLVTLVVGGCASVSAAGFWLCWTVYVGVVSRRWWSWFLVAPVIGALTVVLLLAGAPFKLRWEASRDAFAAVVAGRPVPPPGSAREEFAVPGRLGLYEIGSAAWVPGGAVFWEVNGGYAGAGFAYLPGGPTPEAGAATLDSPVFRSLGGGWYRWSGSS